MKNQRKLLWIGWSAWLIVTCVAFGAGRVPPSTHVEKAYSFQLVERTPSEFLFRIQNRGSSELKLQSGQDQESGYAFDPCELYLEKRAGDKWVSLVRLDSYSFIRDYTLRPIDSVYFRLPTWPLEDLKEISTLRVHIGEYKSDAFSVRPVRKSDAEIAIFRTDVIRRTTTCRLLQLNIQ